MANVVRQVRALRPKKFYYVQVTAPLRSTVLGRWLSLCSAFSGAWARSPSWEASRIGTKRDVSPRHLTERRGLDAGLPEIFAPFSHDVNRSIARGAGWQSRKNPLVAVRPVKARGVSMPERRSCRKPWPR